MASLADKIGSILPLEAGERILCAAYVPAIGTSMGSAVVAVSDRRLLFAPRSAFMTVGAWVSRRLDDVRIETTLGRLGFTGVRRFTIVEAGEPDLLIEFRSPQDARAFRAAFARRLVPRR